MAKLITQSKNGDRLHEIVDLTDNSTQIDLQESGDYLLSGTVDFNIEAVETVTDDFTSASNVNSLALKSSDTYVFTFKAGARISVVKTNISDPDGYFYAVKLI